MAKPASFGHVGVNLITGAGPVVGAVRADTPFRILVLGDLSGQAGDSQRGPNAGVARRPVRVDRDDLDAAIAKFAPALGLRGAKSTTLRFAALDDFHPDRLYPQVELFEHLRQLRQRLQTPSTFAVAAAEVRGWRTQGAAPAPDQKAPAKAEAPTSPGGTGITLDDVLGGSLAAQRWQDANRGGGDVDWNALVQEVVGPHIRAIPAADPRQAELVGSVDAAASALLRAVLHEASFQSLEAAWRGVDFLVRRLETDSQLSIDLLDVSKAELATDLSAGDDLSRTAVYKLLVEQPASTPGGQPWTVVLGAYTFEPTVADAELLGRLARIAPRGDCAFIAAASPRLVRCDSLAAHPDPEDWQQSMDAEVATAWEALRQLPESSHVGLALPRVLLRQPYGKRTSPIEAFAFEELCEPPDHEAFLWGNPAFAVVGLLGEAFSRSGWEMRLGEVSEIDGLPSYSYRADGEINMQPCAEIVLLERGLQAMFDAGLMPLQSIRGRDAVRLASFQSLERSAKSLAGHWRGY